MNRAQRKDAALQDSADVDVVNVEVGLAPISGSVLTDTQPIFLRFTGVERNGALAARACGAFAKMLSKQLDDRLSLSDIIDDSNLVRNNLPRDEEDEVVEGSESEGEGERSGQE